MLFQLKLCYKFILTSICISTYKIASVVCHQKAYRLKLVILMSKATPDVTYLLHRVTRPLFRNSFKQPAENSSFPLINEENLHPTNIFIIKSENYESDINIHHIIKVKHIIRWQTFGLLLPDGWSSRANSSLSVTLFWEKMLIILRNNMPLLYLLYTFYM